MRTIGVLIPIALFAAGVAGHAAGPVPRQATQQTDQSGNSAPASGAQLTPQEITKLQMRGLRNFGVVTPTLYRGGQPTSEGFRTLASMGVNIVVNLRVTHRGDERQEVTELGMQYVEIAWNCFDPQDSDIVKFLTLVRQNPGRKYLCTVKRATIGLGWKSRRIGWRSKDGPPTRPAKKWKRSALICFIAACVRAWALMKRNFRNDSRRALHSRN
jgi:hypothetical protein